MTEKNQNAESDQPSVGTIENEKYLNQPSGGMIENEKYLDRALLVPTLERIDAAFFKGL